MLFKMPFFLCHQWRWAFEQGLDWNVGGPSQLPMLPMLKSCHECIYTSGAGVWVWCAGGPTLWGVCH